MTHMSTLPKNMIYTGTQPTMSEEELWLSRKISHENLYFNYIKYTPRSNELICSCCENNFETKYISFPNLDVELCSKTCHTNYKSKLPEKIWGSIQQDNKSMMIPFHNKLEPFKLLTKNEVTELSISEKESYYEQEEDYCSLYPIKSSIHFQTDRENEHNLSMEEEFNDMSSVDSEDDY